MTNQQKIELGRGIIQKLKFDVTRLNPGKYQDLCFETGTFALNKISETIKKDAAVWLEQLSNAAKLPEPTNSKLICTCYNQFGPETDDKGYICGVCYALKCNECIDNDFERCPICEHDGKIKIFADDKNGASFSSGDTLFREDSTVKILQINETHVVYSWLTGSICEEMQDFIDSGYVVR